MLIFGMMIEFVVMMFIDLMLMISIIIGVNVMIFGIILFLKDIII